MRFLRRSALALVFRTRLLLYMFIFLVIAGVAGETPKSADPVDPFGYPLQTVSASELRKMLSAGQYQKLNAFLQGCQDELEKDFRKEYKLLDAYDALAVTDASYETMLGRWVKATPKCYQPYLARACYYDNMRWESRGYKWAKDTGDEQFQGMENYFGKALDDIEVVLKMYPRSLVAYDLLVGMSMAMSEDDNTDWATRKCLEYYPNSYVIRADYIHSLRPRWGGSYKQMEKYAAEAQEYARVNPRMVLLKGYIPADQASLAKSAEDYRTAVDLYKKALAFGDNWLWHYEMAGAYYYWNKNNEAMVAVNKAAALRPMAAEVFTLRAKIHYSLNKLDRSLEDIKTARALASCRSDYEGGANWIAHQILLEGFELYKAKDYDGAITLYDQARQFDPEYGELYYWRARVFVDRNQLGQARAELETALRYSPTHFDSCLLLDWILAKERNWDLIIAYWSRLIELEPDNARAYLERGGAYYQKGDRAAALADAKKACELGDSEGCKRYKQLSGK